MEARSFVKSAIRSGAVPAYLVTFKDTKDRDCWFYILSTPAKIEAFKALKTGLFNIADHGRVIASGFGTGPDNY
jgi:hypothetical protein